MIYAEYLKVNVGGAYVHFIGNHMRDEGVSMSDAPLVLDDVQRPLLLTRMLSQTVKCDSVFKLWHSVDMSLNFVYAMTQEFFRGEYDMKNVSQNIARHLYEHAYPLKFQGSDIYVVHLKDVILDGDTCDALAIFKAAPKSATFDCIKTGSSREFVITRSVADFESGAIIFNTEAKDGYRIVAFDNSKANGMWFSEFLDVIEVQNAKTYTRGITNIYCGYIQREIDEKFEASPIEKSLLMNKFKTVLENSDNYDTKEFDNAVFEQPEVAEHFGEYRRGCIEASGVQIPESFTLDGDAVKKAARKIARKLRLDSNFYVYINTDNEKLIEQGIDNDIGMNYVKLYYKDEKAIQ